MTGRWTIRRRDRTEPVRGHPSGPGPVVVLDNIRSAFNVGSIFRTCEAAGVCHLYLCGISAQPPNPRVLKTSLGTEQTLPWTHLLSTGAALTDLNRRGLFTVAVELTDRSLPYTEVRYPAQTAFVFGHEVSGVSIPILDQADQVIEIPMLGRKNSLNVATSVGIVLFEYLRQRMRCDQAAGADAT